MAKERKLSEELARLGRFLGRRNKRVAPEGYRPSILLREMGIPMVPSLDGRSRSRDHRIKDDDLPERIGRFEIMEELGRGGRGRVFAAIDPDLGREVAVKLLVDTGSLTDIQLARFVAEAQITAQLDHPNIIPVHEMGVTTDGDIYFVMRRVRGISLEEVLYGQPSQETKEFWTRHRFLRAFGQVCNAVAFAHDRGVLHRDLKPGNIMLGPFGEVFVVDWGVARLLQPTYDRTPAGGLSMIEPDAIGRHTTLRTQDGVAIGTPGYMSPEQVRGHPNDLDARTDVWSLGTVLYELLSGQPAYVGTSPYDLMFQASKGPPVDLRLRVPEQRIPSEIADVCAKALTIDPLGRYLSAAELGDAVEAFLEGSRRRSKAHTYLERAEELWKTFLDLNVERVELEEGILGLEASVPTWAPLEQKAELHRAQERLGDLAPRRAHIFGEFVAQCEKALSHDPENIRARSALAEGYWERLAEAETAGDEAAAAFYTYRVAAYDDGFFIDALQAKGIISVDTEPTGAMVQMQRVMQRGLVWELSAPEQVGPTPIRGYELPMGSYVLTFSTAEGRDTIYPVQVSRGYHWDVVRRPVPVYSDAEIGEEFVYVPGSWTLVGGDEYAPGSLPRQRVWIDGFFIARYPVTMGEYLKYINDLHATDPEQAWRRVPRAESSLDDIGQYWKRAEPGASYVLPIKDRDGDPWHEDWPVMAVSWHDALAYAAWLSERSGLVYELPLDLEWEKAARGVDARVFPWGDRFDPCLCKMRDSRPGAPKPENNGAFPTDRSVYGVFDMAGSMREWCGDLSFDGKQEQRVVRGGAWSYDRRVCRAAARFGNQPWHVFTNYGFRLVRRLNSTED